MEIAKLAVKLREVVLLYYYQNMRIEDIASVLGISISSVSGRLKRAKEKLRRALKGVSSYAYTGEMNVFFLILSINRLFLERSRSKTARTESGMMA